jgi:hypothetical protein
METKHDGRLGTGSNRFGRHRVGIMAAVFFLRWSKVSLDSLDQLRDGAIVIVAVCVAIELYKRIRASSEPT